MTETTTQEHRQRDIQEVTPLALDQFKLVVMVLPTLARESLFTPPISEYALHDDGI